MIGEVATMVPPLLEQHDIDASNSQSTVMLAVVDNENSDFHKYSEHSDGSSGTDSTVEETISTSPISAVEGCSTPNGPSPCENIPLHIGEIDCTLFEAASPPNKTRSQKLSVRFEESPCILAIPGRHEVSDEIASSIWLTPQDLSRIKRDAYILVASVNRKRSEEDTDTSSDDESSSPCLRGLECYLEETQKQRQKTKKIITKAILETQKIQRRQGNGQSALLLAKISMLCSAKSRQEALERARNDVEEVLMQSLSDLAALQLEDEYDRSSIDDDDL